VQHIDELAVTADVSERTMAQAAKVKKEGVPELSEAWHGIGRGCRGLGLGAGMSARRRDSAWRPPTILAKHALLRKELTR
jgi:hypothetical protein